MEDVILGRLSTFATSIADHTVSAFNVCARSPWVQDDIVQASIVASKLTSVLGRFQSDLYQYFAISGEPNADEISTLTTTQLEGEEALAELSARIKAREGTRSATVESTVNRSKLPELDLVTFKGDVLEWTQFWDQFSSNIDQRNLRDVDKLLYLKASLKGKASTIIDGLETTNANYNIAINTLKERYGNKAQIVDAHYANLHGIKRAVKTEDCRKTLDELERHLRVLQSLGEDTNHNHLRFLIIEKFPEDIIYEMKLKLEVDSVENIRKQLHVIISCREEAKGAYQRREEDEVKYTTEALHVKDTYNKKPTHFRKSKPNFRQHEKKHINRGMPSTSQFTFTPKRRPDNSYRNGEHFKRRKLQCIFCEGDHFPDQCNKYLTLSTRRARLTDRCYRCFKKGHNYLRCTFNIKCIHCGKDHNRALCPKKCENHGKAVNTFHVNEKGSTVLQTAIVNVIGQNGRNRKCRVLLDSGSQRSYITQTMAKELKLETVEDNYLSVFTFGAKKPQDLKSPLVQFEVHGNMNKVKTLFANVVPSITQGVNYPEQEINHLACEKGFTLADDGSLSDRIDILIGNDYYYSIMSTEKIKIQEDLYLVNSELGWILSGIVKESATDDLAVLTYFQSSCNCKLNKPDPPLDKGNVRCLWDLESIGITDSPKVNRDEEAIKHFNENTIFKDDRYFVSWPWNEYPPNLPSNLGLATGRLISLLKRMDTENLQVYEQTLKDQLDKGIIEVVNHQVDITHPIHYLPHHGVATPGKKLRIVYDASAKIKNNKSLNECLYCGPMMLEDLTGLLIKFRCHRIGITADVEKAFLQIGLHMKDRDVTRFLWIKDITKPATTDNIVHYRFTRVPFGIVSSPFLLNATIKYHLLTSEKQYIRNLANDIYVDNVLTGANNIFTAMQLYKESKDIFQQISMNLREWSSNSKELMQSIQDSCEDKVVKTLGLNWHIEKDTICLRSQIPDHAYTKRGILKTIATIYDPCGFSVPIVLPAKLLLQSLWKTKLNWDAPLSDEISMKWKTMMEDLKLVNDIYLPRILSNYQDGQLHCFTDASTVAYAAVVYLLQSDGLKFIIGKSRLVPIKDQENLKIPRLELLGVLIGSRLIQYVKKFIPINMTQQILWTDSQIVIDWYNSTKLLSPFVSRRIEEIKKNKDLLIRHVPTASNPADVSTRPTNQKEDLERWLKGPEFLLLQPNKWPCGSSLNKDRSLSLLAGEGLSNSNRWKEHQNIDNENEKITTDDGRMEITDIDTSVDRERNVSSEVQEIRDRQKRFFQEESMGKKTHLSRNLGLFTDVDGLLRCDGRLKHSDLSYDAKHPILLPRGCDYTANVVKKVHETNYHVGVPHTLSLVRQRYWIPQGRVQVQRVLQKCPQCVKHGGGPYVLPDTPDLPPERVTYKSPFTYVGIDYFGPAYIMAGDKEKRWICLFTCLVIRAVHLEIVKDMTAEECSLAVRRFMALRGVPSLIVTDNALQFKLLSEIMTRENLSKEKIRWKFIPQLSPWHGGVYERMVALVKHCLRRTLSKHLLNDSQLSTIIKEVESVVNSRPLTYVGTDLEHVLRPADFLTPGKCLSYQLSLDDLPSATVIKQQLIDGWRRGEIIMKEYEDMFKNRYLLSLRERYKHSPRQPRVKSQREPCVGDIVQIKSDSKNREGWKVGSISEVIKGIDGLCRVAKVRVGDKIYIRSISHLYPLEVEDSLPYSDSIITRSRLDNSTAQEVDKVTIEDFNLPAIVSEERSEANGDVNNDLVDNMGAARGTDVGEKNTEMSETVEEANADVEMMDHETDPAIDFDPIANQEGNERQKRAAAVQAMEKIREWTRHLMKTLTENQ